MLKAFFLDLNLDFLREFNEWFVLSFGVSVGAILNLVSSMNSAIILQHIPDQ